jgi:hypothetical protein
MRALMTESDTGSCRDIRERWDRGTGSDRSGLCRFVYLAGILPTGEDKKYAKPYSAPHTLEYSVPVDLQYS